jgi:hypothetical protein
MVQLNACKMRRFGVAVRIVNIAILISRVQVLPWPLINERIIRSYMKIKGFIIMTVSYAILSVALDLLVYEFDWRSVISSIVQALIFSSLMLTFGFKFMKKVGSKLANSVPAVELTEDERLLLESPATHIKRLEGVGGKLFLTDRRLVFYFADSGLPCCYLS